MPKIIGRSLEEHRQRTREKIFAALADLLETQEFESVTFSRIATAAGVGRTAMYNHFPDRESLLVEYAIHETTDYIAQLRAGVSNSATPRDAAIAYVHTQLDLNVSFHVPQTSGGATLTPEITLPARRARGAHRGWCQPEVVAATRVARSGTSPQTLTWTPP